MCGDASSYHRTKIRRLRSKLHQHAVSERHGAGVGAPGASIRGNRTLLICIVVRAVPACVSRRLSHHGRLRVEDIRRDRRERGPTHASPRGGHSDQAVRRAGVPSQRSERVFARRSQGRQAHGDDVQSHRGHRRRLRRGLRIRTIALERGETSRATAEGGTVETTAVDGCARAAPRERFRCVCAGRDRARATERVSNHPRVDAETSQGARVQTGGGHEEAGRDRSRRRLVISERERERIASAVRTRGGSALSVSFIALVHHSLAANASSFGDARRASALGHSRLSRRRRETSVPFAPPHFAALLRAPTRWTRPKKRWRTMSAFASSAGRARLPSSGSSANRKLDEFGILARARRRFVRARARSKGALDALDALDALVSFRLDARLDRPDALTTSTTGARGDFRQRAPTRRVHRRQRHQRAVRPAIDVEAISRILAHADEISSAFARDEIGDGVRDTRGVSRGRVRRRAVLRLSSADDERFVWVERSRVGDFSAQILGRIIFI